MLADAGLDIGSIFSLEVLQESQHWLSAWVDAAPTRARLLFFLLYLAATCCSVPGTVLLALASGALFGLGWGVLLSSFASALGSLLAFLIARYVLREAVQKRFGDRFQRINQGLQANGHYYLISLRLLPLVPYFLINLGLALSRLRAWTFYWASQLGMLAPTIIYVSAGQRLSELQSLSDLYRWPVLATLLALAALPVCTLAIRRHWLGRRVLGYAAAIDEASTP